MPVIEVMGLASGVSRTYAVGPLDLKINLLTWLRRQEITIASSCDGEGICKKCAIQNGWLTCELTLGEFLERCPEAKILVSYL